jgi:formylmethanofuran dehydrogenase subunit E
LESFIAAMPRILLLIILGWLLFIVVKKVLKIAKHQQTQENETMHQLVICAKCGVHIPKNESQVVDNQIICKKPNCNELNR